VIKILRYFADKGDSSLKDLSSAPSTCHRLLDILASEGMIERSESRSYCVGREFFRIAAVVHAKHNVCAIALPYLRDGRWGRKSVPLDCFVIIFR
jgi:DNA-binding IclR family transcriptional regulator